LEIHKQLDFFSGASLSGRALRCNLFDQHTKPIKQKGFPLQSLSQKNAVFVSHGFIAPPDPPHRKDGLVLCQHTRQTLQSTLWYCSQFLTVIFFVAMLPKHLAHCLFRFAPQSKSQANTQHSNKKTLHSNHHHRSAYASIKTA
jgi:hypothetical protein